MDLARLKRSAHHLGVGLGEAGDDPQIAEDLDVVDPQPRRHAACGAEGGELDGRVEHGERAPRAVAARGIEERLGGRKTESREAGSEHGDGQIYTTIKDLARWDRVFYSDKLGGESFVDRLQTRGVLNDGTEIDYAFGLHLGEHRGLRTVRHGIRLEGEGLVLDRPGAEPETLKPATRDLFW